MADKHKVSGVILIDKPQGMTSQQVVSKVKYLFKSAQHDSRKAGHTGTLDPMATGLLPICLGEATKFSHYQLDADKSYQATIQLGIQTDTGDAEGKTTATADVPALNQTMLDEVKQQFLGAIQQIPPMYSALKKDGKKLYEYARAGQEVERQARTQVISQLTLSLLNDTNDSNDANNTNTQIQLTVTCSKGTYVRVLAEDIAKALGTLGHLTMLRRTQVGDFHIDASINLQQLEALTHQQRLAKLLPMDACLGEMMAITLDDEQIARIRMGQRLNVRQQLADLAINLPAATHNTTSTLDVRVVNQNNGFVGLATLEATGRLQPKKIIPLSACINL